MFRSSGVQRRVAWGVSLLQLLPYWVPKFTASGVSGAVSSGFSRSPVAMIWPAW